MPRDLAKNTLAAAKSIQLRATPRSFKDGLSPTDQNDLFRFSLNQRSALDLRLDSSKGSVVGVQIFSLKGAKQKVLRAIGRREFSTLKTAVLKKYLRSLANGKSANGKDKTLNLDLPSGEYYVRLRQIKGTSRYSLNLAASPAVTPPSTNPPSNNPPIAQPPGPSAVMFGRRWVQQFGTSGNDYTYGTTVDRAGNLYVAGVANANAGPAGDGFVAKYAADGTQLWRRSIDTTGADVAFDVAVDDAGNYYVTGAVVTGVGLSTNSDGFVAKYSSDGTRQWIESIATTVQVFGLTQNAVDAGLGIALDGNDLFVSGLVKSSPVPVLGKGFIAKYNAATGAQDNGFGAGTGRVEFGAVEATAAVDLVARNGVLYTTGITGATVSFSDGFEPTGGNAFVAAFNSTSGNTLWSQTLSSGSSQTYARGIAVVGSDVYITGQTTGALPAGSLPANRFAGGTSDAFLAKYSGQGVLQWSKQFGTAGLDEAQAIAVDSAGKIYVTGETDQGLFGPALGKTDTWLAQYDSAGTLTGSTQFGTDREDEAYGVTIDSTGGVYLAGQTQGAFSGLTNTGNYDAWVAQYEVLLA